MFKCGLEIHQRLSGRKLFSYCYFDGVQGKQDFVLVRKLSAVVGETGVVDAASAFESKKHKFIEYVGDFDTASLVESDEEPPLEVSEDALRAVLVLCKALNARIIDEIHFMRKIITDGSNTSGFQRTALVGVNGFIETKKGRVGIQSIALEEESAGIVDKGENKFRLDRLGVPLVEIATAPDIVDGEHARETAELLGGLLRDSGLVQRGLGTIRQDLNVSVGHDRVELKGVQDLSLLSELIENEAERQKKEGVRQGGETRVIKGVSSEFMRPLATAARMYPETDVLPIVISKELFESSDVEIISSSEKLDSLLALGVGKQLAEKLSKASEYALFKFLVETKVETNFIASTLLETLVSLRREGVEVEKISREQLKDLFTFLVVKKIVKTAVVEVLRELPSGKSVQEIINEKNLRRMGVGEVRKLLALYPDKKKAFGEIMRKYRLNVDAADVQELLNE
ncbi:MAG: hypothetical protein ABH803_04315 [Candidatus Micrarchaeota archaeon]